MAGAALWGELELELLLELFLVGAALQGGMALELELSLTWLGLQYTRKV